MVVGNLLGKVRRNHWVDIRIPWTLADEDNWDKSNRYAGRVMVIVGIAMFATAFLLPEQYGVGTILLGTVVITVLPVAKSYALSRSHQPRID